MKQKAGFIVLKGNLFNAAIMKTSVISKEFRARYLSNPKNPNVFNGKAAVFEGPEDYHKMSSSAHATLQGHISKEKAKERLELFFNGLLVE